jgi:hypothetical protein
MPDEIDWSNVDLQRYGYCEIISGKTFDILVLEVENLNPATRESISAHFEKCLRNVVSEAREIFYDNLDNIIAHVNRDAIAEALNADREARDQEAMDLILADFSSNTRQWRPISPEKFNYMLECLPPIRMGRGGFVNSEPWDFLDNGEEIYFVALQANGGYYATLGTLAEWDSKDLTLSEDIPQW